jgi:Na+/melibiose symporter-like transporter
MRSLMIALWLVCFLPLAKAAPPHGGAVMESEAICIKLEPCAAFVSKYFVAPVIGIVSTATQSWKLTLPLAAIFIIGWGIILFCYRHATRERLASIRAGSRRAAHKNPTKKPVQSV